MLFSRRVPFRIPGRIIETTSLGNGLEFSYFASFVAPTSWFCVFLRDRRPVVYFIDQSSTKGKSLDYMFIRALASMVGEQNQFRSKRLAGKNPLGRCIRVNEGNTVV